MLVGEIRHSGRFYKILKFALGISANKNRLLTRVLFEFSM